MHTVTVQGRRLEYVRLPAARPRPGAPAMVFLHEGLGSVSLWRDFPQRVADATGCEAVVYSRYGHGRSDPLLASREVAYLHDEALLALPEFLDRLAIERPFLLGHSDGGSIALIHAGGCRRPVRGIIAMAPHVLVEDITLAGIARARAAYRTTDLPRRLGRHHSHGDAVFRGWNDIWLRPDFRAWNIEAYLPDIAAPILAIQGEDDEYGTLDQIERIARQAKDVDLVKLADCRHSPHRDQPEAVIAAVSAFVARCLEGPGRGLDLEDRAKIGRIQAIPARGISERMASIQTPGGFDDRLPSRPEQQGGNRTDPPGTDQPATVFNRSYP